jgi:hypothetical protein
MQRPDYGEIVGPYLNSNITDLVKQSFYVGDDCIAARTDELGKRDPQLRAAFPHLFAWHLKLPLQAYLVVAASVSS